MFLQFRFATISTTGHFLSYMIIIPVPCFFINGSPTEPITFKVLNDVLDILHFLLLEHESLLARIKLRHFMFLDNFPKRLKSGYEGTPQKSLLLLRSIRGHTEYKNDLIQPISAVHQRYRFLHN
jgi:hypothetical protein